MNMHVGSELALELHRQAIERRKRMAMAAKPKAAPVVVLPPIAPVVIRPHVPARVLLARVLYADPIGPLQPKPRPPWVIYEENNYLLYKRLNHYARRHRDRHPLDARLHRLPIGPQKPTPSVAPPVIWRDVLEIRTRAVTEITGAQIIKEVCAKHGVEEADLLSHRRTANLTLPRFEAVYRMRTETLLSFPQMGRLLRRDHTSSVYAYHKFCKMIADGKVERPSLSIAAE